MEGKRPGTKKSRPTEAMPRKGKKKLPEEATKEPIPGLTPATCAPPPPMCGGGWRQCPPPHRPFPPPQSRPPLPPAPDGGAGGAYPGSSRWAPRSVASVMTSAGRGGGVGAGPSSCGRCRPPAARRPAAADRRTAAVAPTPPRSCVSTDRLGRRRRRSSPTAMALAMAAPAATSVTPPPEPRTWKGNGARRSKGDKGNKGERGGMRGRASSHTAAGQQTKRTGMVQLSATSRRYPGALPHQR